MTIIKSSDICRSDPMPFCQHWEARMVGAISDVEDFGEALHSNYQRFQPGDSVTICAYSSDKFEHLAEIVSLRIVSVDNNRLRTMFTSEVIKVPPKSEKELLKDAMVLTIVPIRNAFDVIDQHGNIIDTFVERGQAEEFIKRYEMKKKPAARDMSMATLDLRRGQAGKWVVKNEQGEVVREFSKKEDAEAFIAEHEKAAA